MYLKHFGMQEMPFSITPDTSFFYNHGSYHEALNVLLVAVRSGEGFIKISGEVGSGKTLLCRKLLNSLKQPDYVTAYFPNPCLTPAALRMALADELGITPARNVGQHRILQLITQRLIELNAEGKHIVLLLDEAQALPDDSMEALRLLSNLETEKNKLLQVVLFGQPELDERLSQAKLRQLRQRITFSYRLRAIDPEGLSGYVAHRLAVAGYQGRPVFSKAALKTLYRCSRGIPRLVNILCHKTLMVAYGRGADRINTEYVSLAAKDTEDASTPSRGNLLQFGIVILDVATVSAIALAIYLYGFNGL